MAVNRVIGSDKHKNFLKILVQTIVLRDSRPSQREPRTRVFFTNHGVQRGMIIFGKYPT